MNPLDKPRELTTDDEIAALLARTKRICVLGIKTEKQSDQPAFYVPKYLQSAGFEIVPVPVYYPDATQILDQPVFRTLAAVPKPIDLVDVFRLPHDIPQHVDDMIAARPFAVWFQQGIRHDEVARTLVSHGIFVVQDWCLLVAHRRFGKV